MSGRIDHIFSAIILVGKRWLFHLCEQKRYMIVTQFCDASTYKGSSVLVLVLVIL